MDYLIVAAYSHLIPMTSSPWPDQLPLPIETVHILTLHTVAPKM